MNKTQSDYSQFNHGVLNGIELRRLIQFTKAKASSRSEQTLAPPHCGPAVHN